MIGYLGNIYRDAPVLVTGHTGFKGGWLSLWLGLLGAKVIGYSLEEPSHPSFLQSTDLAAGIIHVHGDIRDLAHVKRIFNKYQPIFVFHLAAQSLVLRSYEEPHLTYETNIIGTVNILEAIRSTGSVKAGVIITSDKCYENQGVVWGYRENDPLGGRDPYSSSKGCAELIASAYLRSYFPPEGHGSIHQVALASARAGNVIGGGDWGADRLVPDCVKALSHGTPISLRNPRAVRPWQYILEPLLGYLILGAKLGDQGSHLSGPWNFGPLNHDFRRVEQMVQAIIRLWGQGTYVIDTNAHLPEAHWLKLDCSKANLELGWQPRYGIDTALEKTIKWYKKYYGGADAIMMRKYSISQIQDYTDTIK